MIREDTAVEGIKVNNAEHKNSHFVGDTQLMNEGDSNLKSQYKL